jgi:hypothetical protein
MLGSSTLALRSHKSLALRLSRIKSTSSDVAETGHVLAFALPFLLLLERTAMSEEALCRLEGRRGRRAEDHHDGDASRKKVGRAWALGRTVGQRAEDNVEEDAREPGQPALHYRP